MKTKLKEIFKSEILIFAITFFITSITTLLSINSPFSKVFPWLDSSGFLYDGKSLLSGLIMYNDFFDHKGPLIFVINAFGLLIGGIKGVWLLEFISILLFLYFSCKSIILFADKKTAIFSVILLSVFMPYYLDIGNFTESFSLIFIGISLYIFTNYFYSKSYKINFFKSVVLGICFMGVLLLRPNVAVLWVIFFPVLFFDLINKKEIKQSYLLILNVIIGCIIMFFPYIIYFTIHDVWGEFYYQYILLNFVYIGSGTGFFLLKHWIV